MGRRANAYKYSKIGSAHTPKDNPIFLIAPTIQSHEIWNSRHEWEVGKIQGSSNTGARVEPVARVDAVFLERMRQTHISPYLVYTAVGAVLHLTIDYIATSDSYSTLVNAHFPPQEYERKMVQATKAREYALHMRSWKERNTREQLDLKAQSGSIEGGEGQRGRARRYSPGSCLCCTSVLSNALPVNVSDWAEDKTRLAGAEAAFRGFWKEFLGFQVGEVCLPWDFELKSFIDWGEGDEKETPPKLDQPCAKCKPGGGNMWSAYPRQLETHEGEESKNLETLPSEWAE